MIDTDAPIARPRTQVRASLRWVDCLKAVAILWIVLNHFVERFFGGPYAANPSVDWPPLGARIAQFAPVHVAGALRWPLTVLRDVGWFGDQGVTLFIISSGFGLTWGLLSRQAPAAIPLAQFYRRRAARILPLWWGAHVLFLATIVLPYGLSTGEWQFYASFAGLRFLPPVFYYYSPAWWYVGLAIQLYLVYPFLWRALRTCGAAKLLVAGSLAGFVAIAIGPFVFHDAYLDEWQRGAFFFTRLPEFVLGIALASWWYADAAAMRRRMRSPLAWGAAAIVYALATALSFTLRGMIVAPLLLGASALVLLFPLVTLGADRDGPFQRLGRESYPVYLVHDPLILLSVSGTFSGAKTAIEIVAALAATAIAAYVLVVATNAALGAFERTRRARGTAFAASCALAIAAVVVAVPIVADLAVLRYDPQEVNGWGERVSLAPSERFGWTLAPSRTTRLRWESYDYTVTANALGFPGPLFPDAKPANAERVFVTGDAFSSAEGVDTGRSWPRVMQGDLRALEPARDVQVLNFSITGYGPNQEAAVVAAFVPRYRPNVVLVEMFANDVEDATTSNDAFRASIGFARPAPVGVRSVLGLDQLRTWLALRVDDPIVSRLKRAPTAEGYFLGSFRLLERNRPDYDGAGVRIASQRYREIAAVAKRAGARVAVVFVPTPVEVCGPAALRYYPRGVDLGDRARFDTEATERRARRIAAAAGVELWDLRPLLRSLAVCPYMPRNLHLTVAGNAAVARYVAGRLAALRD